MIEKVANALYEFHGVKSMSIAKDMARAAVEAMRDLYKDLPGPMSNKDDSDRLNAAIDTALKE
jgi:hypothetical protein